MAIGDNFSVYLVANGGTRQPASGVFEKITACSTIGTSDALMTDDGTTEIHFQAASVNVSILPLWLNVNVRIGNTVYCSKQGTTDIGWVAGVQVDA